MPLSSFICRLQLFYSVCIQVNLAVHHLIHWAFSLVNYHHFPSCFFVLKKYIYCLLKKKKNFEEKGCLALAHAEALLSNVVFFKFLIAHMTHLGPKA